MREDIEQLNRYRRENPPKPKKVDSWQPKEEFLLDPSQFDNYYDFWQAEKRAREVGVASYLASRPKRAATAAEAEELSKLPPAAMLAEARRRGLA